ncbi:hypothetical protein [Mycoplana rhizolycopersici]|jgi:hypothetical protein|uniref:Uncharacterized protein n=1 Tax=Mycoplana rhizolycopersici TaxID=2746702 RepID=A0ABX2Q8Z7_9HYPH|nr:hypothetical protein [Rhizobium rhizolycopersici]NVP54189.1 hypothetical protein [Rhizobium rhizolycopersici]
MHDFDDVDPGLFGLPATQPAYDGFAAGVRWGEGGAAAVLDLKSEVDGDPLGDMQAMLSQMTKELRERFQRFQSQRRSAEQIAAEAADEAERKLGQADAKAAIEAVSLIVRTLEKIDSLQRTIMSERRDAEERQGEVADIDALIAEFDRRVEAKARAYLEKWKAEHGTCAERTEGGAVSGSGADGKNGP